MKFPSQVPQFQSRWLITGTLETGGPLHIGGGGTKSIPGPDGETHEVSTVAIAHDGKPYIPGSTLKGALRDLAEEHASDETHRNRLQVLFGHDSPDAVNASGGLIEICDCYFMKGPAFNGDRFRPAGHLAPRPTGEPPGWCESRCTGVATSVCIDRDTRAAREKLLHNVEYVPAGVSFAVEILVESADENDIKLLLGLLKALRLGGGASSGWGKLEWGEGSFHVLGEKQLKDSFAAWLADPSTMACGNRLVQECGISAKVTPPEPSNPPDLVEFEFTLRFSGPLLIRRTSTKPKGVKNAEDYDATPVLDENGLPIIPSKSMRGVMRFRAEMIMRTLDHSIPRPWELKPKPYKDLDAVSKVFGAPGWRSPLGATAWKCVDSGTIGEHRQEFVAIDRFTGGAANQKKFKAMAVLNAAFEGKITLDRRRLKKCGADTYAFGLLALVLRDIAEQDVVFGSKGSIGYGICDWNPHLLERYEDVTEEHSMNLEEQLQSLERIKNREDSR